MIALVLGAADCLLDDLREAKRLVDPEQCLVVAANDAGFVWDGHLDHWATCHPEELWLRKRKRAELGLSDDYETWTRPYPWGLRKEREELCDHVLNGYDAGSSGLLAVGVALECGADRIILCGMPMDDRRHAVRKRKWIPAGGYRDRWVELHTKLSPVVRSFSGWTRERFGEPTAEWVNAREAA